ncbi:3-deoxy-7-phosphoheptulonate synthase [Nocardia sp. CDC186]|uniref:Phospho-2-dehydro-3-deoxyheptonate aldolase n=1 Tax=Nocardia implantans TaxID=3108168 RepID=A0ABU6ARY1_9NOCA|nr:MULTISPECIES: 3-deoxy-7-phosphoheptulonate synthase [unclassified Nocardia]MBF6191683.1 3-deoxy-7-phosphoheptulonate synthase [Nocardia beijingensis]MEA3528008.1 3-deoxy-7-phosphoheptulonate synthase [Nocardia sp. CDC192]MEB3510240.1 3-deoxy-7-phosphoheptulonate synthase [Nocardia sp. CDC186]
MTITHTGTEPPGDCPPGGSGFRKHDEIGRFGHPLTRMLLASDGFTTPALAAILRTDLHVRVLRQDDISAGRLPNTVTDALGVADSDRVLVRRSCLVSADLVTVSVNYVVAVRAGAAASGMDDVRVPIGTGLIARGVSQRRHLLRTGVTRWPDGRLCAARAYVMTLGDRPLCYIRESFNPDVIPPDYDATAGADPPWADEPLSARPGSFAVANRLFAARESSDSEQPGAKSTALPIRTRRPRHGTELPHPSECDALTADLARAARGEGFVLHLDGRDDLSGGSEITKLAARRALMYAAAAVMTHGLGATTITIERAAKRHGDPRAAAALDGWPADRLPLTLCVHLLRRAADRSPAPVRRDLLRAVSGLLPVAAIAPPGAGELHTWLPRPRVSREPSVSPGAQQAGREPDGRWWDRSAHLLWLGDRAGPSARGRMRVAGRAGNPVAVTLGPTTTPADIEYLCRTLNPRRQPGRLTLVPQLGLARTRDALAALFAAAAACETPICWVCDPMPYPRITRERSTFRSEDVVGAIGAFFHACRASGTVPGGLHLRCGPDAVLDAPDAHGAEQPAAQRRRRGEPGLDPVETLLCVVAALELRAEWSPR